MNGVMLTKKQMLEYWDSQSAFPITVLRDAKKLNIPIKTDTFDKVIESNKKIRDAIEKVDEDHMFFIPNLTMEEVSDIILSAKSL